VIAAAGCAGGEADGSAESGMIDTTLKQEEPNDAAPVASADREGIEAAVRSSDGIAEGMKYAVQVVEVSGAWAYAVLKPENEATDDAQVLLKKDGGWRVLDLGTSLDGKEFGLPDALAEKWGM
jgi:hypothetical protein